MTNFVSGQTVTVNGRKAKIFTILTESILKVRFEEERHSDIISVDEIDKADKAVKEQKRPVFDSDEDMQDYYRIF